MGSFSSSKSTSTSGPAPYTAPYVQGALQNVQDQVQQQQPALNAYGAIAGIGGAAMAPGAFQTSPYVDNAQGAARAISNGAFLGGNPGASTYARLQNPNAGAPRGGMFMGGAGAGIPSMMQSDQMGAAATPLRGYDGEAWNTPNDGPLPTLSGPPQSLATMLAGGAGGAGGNVPAAQPMGAPRPASDPSTGLLSSIAHNQNGFGGDSTLGSLTTPGTNPADRYATAIAKGQYLNNQPSAGLYNNIMSSDYLKGNPYLDNIIGQTNADVTKAANQQFGARGMGAGLSSAFGDVLSKNLANNEGQLRYQNYNDAAGRQLTAAGQSDAAFGAERGRMDASTGLLASNYNAGQDRSLAAAQALNASNQAQQAQRLSAAQSLGSQFNSGQDRSLAAATQADTQQNAQVQQMLQALGLTGQLSDAQYAGVDPTIKALTAGGTIPLLGPDALQAAIANLTGATNTSTSTTKGPGLGASLLGSAASAAGSAFGAKVSERRLKTNIEKVGELHDGLNVYDFDYMWGGPRQRGVMVDEVEKLRPWALGPITSEGYRTVNYGAL